MSRGLLVLALCACLPAGAFADRQDVAKRDADGLEKKLGQILARGETKPLPAAKPLRTPISEREVNSYFKFQGRDHLPVGVLDPNVFIVDGTRLEARAMVDLTAVRKANERTWPILLSWVSGTLELRASARVRAANGMGQLEIESTTLGGVPIPKTLLQMVVSHYSATPESPGGFNLDQPFALPHQIRQVELARGTAVIVQ
jgi:hypothetical protein